MKKKYFKYSQNPKTGKYIEITEDEYLEAKATKQHFFICLNNNFFECELEEYHDYFVKMNRSYNAQRDKNGHRIKPKSYDELDETGCLESMMIPDTTVPTTEQFVEERLHSEWEIKALHTALGKLKPYEKDLIHEIYWNNISQNALAKKYGISQQTMNEKVNRILCKLLKLMNSEK